MPAAYSFDRWQSTARAFVKILYDFGSNKYCKAHAAFAGTHHLTWLTEPAPLTCSNTAFQFQSAHTMLNANSFPPKRR